MNKLTLDIADKKEDLIEYNVQFAHAGLPVGEQHTLNYGLVDNYEFLDAPSTISVSSTTVVDTNISFDIYGLDQDYKEISETIILDETDGTVAVNTESEFYRVNFIEKTDASPEIAGLINFVATGTTHVLGTVVAETDRSYFSNHTVPYNYEYYLNNISINCASDLGTTVDFELVIGDDVRTFTIQAPLTYNYEFSVPYKIDPKTDIILKATSKDAEVSISGTYHFVIRKLENIVTSEKVVGQASYMKYLSENNLTIDINNSQILIVTTNDISNYFSDNFELVDTDTVCAKLPLAYDSENNVFGSATQVVLNFGVQPIYSQDYVMTTDKEYFYILYKIVDSSGTVTLVKPLNTMYGSTNYKFTLNEI